MTNFDNLPRDLRDNALFCLWKYEEVDGRQTKVPYNPKTKGHAQSTNPGTFAKCEFVRTAAEGFDGAGIGVFNGFTGFDIDHCVEDGKLSPMAQDIVHRLDSYTELSPSGTGVRIIVKTDPMKYEKDKYYINNRKKGLEIYVAGCTNKFVSVTGNVIQASPVKKISEKVLEGILDDYMQRSKTEPVNKPVQARPLDLTDQEIIDRAKASKSGDLFTRLYEGDYTGYASQSEADQAFCNMLAFWCAGDMSRMDAIFRTSGLYRKKWEKNGYRKGTLEKAVAGCKEYFTPQEPDQQPHNIQTTWTEEDSTQPCTQPVVNPEQAEGPKAFTAWKAIDLQQAEIPKPYFCVEGMIPQGLTVLASPPKYGKTWLGLDMCIQVATGEDFLGFKTNQGSTLYIDLETYPGAMKDRLNLITDGLTVPEGFNMAFKEDTVDMAHGFLEQLEAYRQANPGLNLVVIDVLQKVKYPQKKGELLYDTEYRTGQELSKWGQDHKVCVVALTHTTKFVHDDPLECVSGSNGVTGSADSVIVLQKDDRFGKNATMSIMCRYAESGQHNIQFDTYRWHNLGSLDFGKREDLEQRQRIREYKENDTRLKLLQFLTDKKEWKGRAGQLKDDALEAGIPFMDQAKAIGGFLCNRDNRAYLNQVDNIRVEVIDNGTGSKGYHITQLTNKDVLEEQGFTEDRDGQADIAFPA